MKQKRQNLRFDRVLIVAGALIVIMVIIGIILSLITNSIEKKKNKPHTTQDSSSKSMVVSKPVDLDYENQYLNISSIHEGNLILVNDDHKYEGSSEKSADFVVIDDNKNPYFESKSLTLTMDKNALKALNNMTEGFFIENNLKEPTGKTGIMIKSAYVSPEEQNIIYNQALDNVKKMSKGGFSEHQTGLCTDLSFSSNNSITELEYEKWFSENCYKYGFIIRYPENKSETTGIKNHKNHFRYLGLPHAYYISQNDLTLEEYIEELKKYSISDKLSFSFNSKQYEIYYEKAKPVENDSQKCEVCVPRDNSSTFSTISGNNIDGFIITTEK